MRFFSSLNYVIFVVLGKENDFDIPGMDEIAPHFRELMGQSGHAVLSGSEVFGTMTRKKELNRKTKEKVPGWHFAGTWENKDKMCAFNANLPTIIFYRSWYIGAVNNYWISLMNAQAGQAPPSCTDEVPETEEALQKIFEAIEDMESSDVPKLDASQGAFTNEEHTEIMEQSALRMTAQAKAAKCSKALPSFQYDKRSLRELDSDGHNAIASTIAGFSQTLTSGNWIQTFKEEHEFFNQGHSTNEFRQAQQLRLPIPFVEMIKYDMMEQDKPGQYLSESNIVGPPFKDNQAIGPILEVITILENENQYEGAYSYPSNETTVEKLRDPQNWPEEGLLAIYVRINTIEPAVITVPGSPPGEMMYHEAWIRVTQGHRTFISNNVIQSTQVVKREMIKAVPGSPPGELNESTVGTQKLKISDTPYLFYCCQDCEFDEKNRIHHEIEMKELTEAQKESFLLEGSQQGIILHIVPPTPIRIQKAQEAAKENQNEPWEKIQYHPCIDPTCIQYESYTKILCINPQVLELYVCEQTRTKPLLQGRTNGILLRRRLPLITVDMVLGKDKLTPLDNLFEPLPDVEVQGTTPMAWEEPFEYNHSKEVSLKKRLTNIRKALNSKALQMAINETESLGPECNQIQQYIEILEKRREAILEDRNPDEDNTVDAVMQSLNQAPDFEPAVRSPTYIPSDEEGPGSPPGESKQEADDGLEGDFEANEMPESVPGSPPGEKEGEGRPTIKIDLPPEEQHEQREQHEQHEHHEQHAQH